MIGDCETAALVHKNGSIDWLCFPRFDSPACFAALLGTEEHGHFRIAPVAAHPKVARRYREGTLILETRFETDEGAVTLIDFMPLGSGVRDVVRIVRGERGRVPMRMDLLARFDYGSAVPWVTKIAGGYTVTAGPDLLRLAARVPARCEDDRICASFTVEAGDEVEFHLAWGPSHETLPVVPDAHHSLALTEEWWRKWSGACRFKGPFRETAIQSVVILKALTYAPTGGIVAAPTTSLPEHFGGVRNWDYRYCWLRDATFTLLALMDAGYEEEARSFREWLLRATAGKPSQAHIMYGVAGERRLDERELPWLPGFAGSSPVRIGNGAYDQFQLDVYGEVMDALHQCWKRGLAPGPTGWRLERALLDFVETAWERPDEGIWEVRGPSRHFTHSKLMAWVAVDRGVKAVEELGLEGPLERWKALRARIHEQICREGYDAERGAFVQFYGSKHLDASLLMMPLVGFLPATDPRVRSTIEAIERELTTGAFVARYKTDPEVDGLPEGEGSFLLCSFWLVDCLVMLGRKDDALRIFEKLLSVRNDVGLLSESYDTAEHRLAGNFPQAYSHVGLLNTARLFEPDGESEGPGARAL
jgi:GH15 family glucan-1,4-alpha-glucosidase